MMYGRDMDDAIERAERLTGDEPSTELSQVTLELGRLAHERMAGGSIGEVDLHNKLGQEIVALNADILNRPDPSSQVVRVRSVAMRLRDWV